MMVRQGDLLINRVEKLPTGKKKPRKNRILAHGEVTGHHHELTAGEVFEIGKRVFFTTKKNTTLTHQEHGHIEFEPGTYEVTRQREYTARKKRAVYVRD